MRAQFQAVRAVQLPSEWALDTRMSLGPGATVTQPRALATRGVLPFWLNSHKLWQWCWKSRSSPLGGSPAPPWLIQPTFRQTTSPANLMQQFLPHRPHWGVLKMKENMLRIPWEAKGRNPCVRISAWAESRWRMRLHKLYTNQPQLWVFQLSALVTKIPVLGSHPQL